MSVSAASRTACEFIVRAHLNRRSTWQWFRWRIRGTFSTSTIFRIKQGAGEEFIRKFEEFDYSDANPMHKSSAQVRDGVLCRDSNDPHRFFLIGEWKSIEEHRKILTGMAGGTPPAFLSLIEGGPSNFRPLYADVVSKHAVGISQIAAPLFARAACLWRTIHARDRRLTAGGARTASSFAGLSRRAPFTVEKGASPAAPRSGRCAYSQTRTGRVTYPYPSQTWRGSRQQCGGGGG